MFWMASRECSGKFARFVKVVLHGMPELQLELPTVGTILVSEPRHANRKAMHKNITEWCIVN
jgi:hypothetical protein